MTSYAPISSTADEYLRTEATKINALRDEGSFELAATRIALLREAGWTISSLAIVLDVSRSAIASWGPPSDDLRKDALALGPIQYLPKSTIEREVRSRDPYFTMIDSLDYTTFDVPAPLVAQLRMLVRYAYMSRSSGPRTAPLVGTRTHKGGALTDYNIAADVLDVVLSVLTRRGVTAYRISALEGVTHRAVLSRMRRATERVGAPGRYLTENVVLGDNDSPFSGPEWWTPVPQNAKYIPISTIPGGTRLTIRTMLSGQEYEQSDPRLTRWVNDGHIIARTELDVARALASPHRTWVMVPSTLLSFADCDTAANHCDLYEILPEIVFTKAAPSELVMQILEDPLSLEAEAPQIRKHPLHAKTRKENREAS